MSQNRLAARLVGFMLIVFLETSAFGATGLFKPVRSYPSGGPDAHSIAVADINGDGKLDVIVANADLPCCVNGSVGVLLGNGDGTFQAVRTYYSGGDNAVSLTVRDVNDDGKADILVANLNGVGVLLGNGDGTFQVARTYASGGGFAQAIAVGDVNGDGKFDLVVNNAESDDDNSTVVGVLLGNGDGTFGAPQIYNTGGYSAGSEGNTVALADVNKDGKLDILVSLYCVLACSNGGFAGVLLGNGDGTFQPVKTYSAIGSYPTAITAGDLNGDGALDLVLAGHVLLGNGDGTFQTAQPIDGFSGGLALALADINRDGKLDLIAADLCTQGSQGKPCVGWSLLGNGDGTFQAGVRYLSGGWGGQGVTVADVNGDGKPDLLFANQCIKKTDCSSGTVGVLLNDTTFTTTTSLSATPDPSVQNQAVTLTAVVTSVGSIMPTGTVTIKNGTTTIGTPKLVGGVATVTRKNLPVGTLSITATYNGDLQSAKSTSPAFIQVVNPPADH
jgi:Bacterial Ig-like domain (group 3)/FG-GAP-like repeat/FG-GAP repeat